MKSSIHGTTRTVTALLVTLFGLAQAQSQIDVIVDSTKNWQGYVNVWGPDGSTYIYGQEFGTADLRAAFIPTNSPSGWPLNTDLVLKVNTNTYNPADVFWNNPDGSPNKVIEANFYRDVGTNFAGQTVTFTGTVTSNTIPAPSGGAISGWTSVCFVKEFTTSYGFLHSEEVALPASGPFTVSWTIGAGHVAQYGFYVKGPNTAPGSANSLTGIGILVEDSDPAITNQPAGFTTTAGVTTNLTVGAIGSGPLTYQWKTNGVDLVDGAKYSGVNTKTLTIANAQPADAAAYVVTVSNTLTSATVDSTPAQVNVLDIVILANPVSQRVQQDSTVVFNAAVASSSSLIYRWKSVIGGVTNNLVDGPNVSGATTTNLTLSNVQVASNGNYFLNIIALPSGKFANTQPATLLVKSYADYPNFLENAGFENDPAGLDETPWSRFESADTSFGVFQDANDTYFGGGNVNVHEGTYVSFTTFNGAYSGIYQDVAASPGQTFTADMWFYNASGDPIPGPDQSSSTNESYLEVQFRDAGDGVIQQYITNPFMDYTTPQNTWFNLQATNAGGYGYNPPTQNAKYLVAPAGTAKVRFQVTMHAIASSIGLGSLYYDSASLRLKTPTTLSVVRNGANIDLSWNTLGSTSYQVQSKNSLSDPTWTNVETVAGTGLTVTKSYPATGDQRVYRVLTL